MGKIKELKWRFFPFFKQSYLFSIMSLIGSLYIIFLMVIAIIETFSPQIEIGNSIARYFHVSF